LIQRTLVFVKPDGVQRGLVGEIISRLEERGLKLIAMKMMRISADLAARHYAEHQGKAFYSVLFLCAAAAAGIVLIPGLPLVYVVLMVNVIAVLAMPPALVFLFLLVNDKEIMRDIASPWWANALATAVVVLLTLAGVLFGISVAAPKIFAALGGR
jgi:Mn2+/Fe2+ NRAMP family transporter